MLSFVQAGKGPEYLSEPLQRLGDLAPRIGRLTALKEIFDTDT